MEEILISQLCNISRIEVRVEGATTLKTQLMVTSPTASWITGLTYIHGQEKGVSSYFFALPRFTGKYLFITSHLPYTNVPSLHSGFITHFFSFSRTLLHFSFHTHTHTYYEFLASLPEPFAL